MGLTIGSVHIYSPSMVDTLPGFRRFSEGWQTYTPETVPDGPFPYQKLAKEISQRVDAPVLWCCIFDSEDIMIEFYKSGKKAASYFSSDASNCKNLYKIPSLVGYSKGQKRRLSKIISCADIEYQLQLLEEYFGVCLSPFPELLEEDPNALSRIREDRLYQSYLAEEKKLTGKSAPVGAELVFERAGKLFEDRFENDDPSFRPHHYYFGYETEASNYQDDPIRPVRFNNGRLEPITQQEFDSAPAIICEDRWTDERLEEEYLTEKIYFTDKAPIAFRNKTLVKPRGHYFFCFDEKERILLSDERGGLVIIDDTLKVIAKLRLKGEPRSYSNGYILTTGDRFGGYYFEPSAKIRIYRLFDK